LSKRQREVLKRLLVRAFNKNQILILSEIKDDSTITSFLTNLSRDSEIPLSTLKLNAKILKQLDLISFNSTAQLTKFGKFILKLLGGDIPT